MQKTLTFTVAFLLSFVFLASAADKDDCFKVSGNTPDEAFRAAVSALKEADGEMGEGWMKDNMQIRLLPNKVKGQFIAVIYSTVYHADSCDLEMVQRVAEEPRPNCDKTQCTI